MIETIKTNRDSLANTIKKGDTFKINVFTFNKTQKQPDKVAKIETLVYALGLDDYKVELDETKVTHIFNYFEQWENTSESNNNEYVKKLTKCFLAKHICNGKSSLVNDFNLKDRRYIGNTTMDPCLAFIMANMGKVKKGSLVYDPFVGTGSLLLSSAYFDAFVAGADLDYNLLHSRGASSRMGQKYRQKEETIYNNLKQHNLENKYLDVIVADSSTKYLYENVLFDAIITDPPYGIREKTKRIGDKKKHNEDSNTTNSTTYPESSFRIPQTMKYQLSDIFTDLLEFSSKHLVENGRLVFWLPIYSENRQNIQSESELNELFQEFIPYHSKFDLISVSEQRLTLTTSRLLITMSYTSSNKENLQREDKNISDLNDFRNNYFKSKKL